LNYAIDLCTYFICPHDLMLIYYVKLNYTYEVITEKVKMISNIDKNVYIFLNLIAL
jgi:hypothetical protein